MKKLKLVLVVRFAFIFLMILWGVSLVGSQTQNASVPNPVTAQSRVPQQQQRTITDAAGRVHVRNARVKHSDRKAVAKRMAKARAAKAAQKRQVTK